MMATLPFSPGAIVKVTSQELIPMLTFPLRLKQAPVEYSRASSSAQWVERRAQLVLARRWQIDQARNRSSSGDTYFLLKPPLSFSRSALMLSANPDTELHSGL